MMKAITEERALLVDCYTAMREIAGTLASVQGASVEYRNPEEMTGAEILTEMRDALHAAQREIMPALEHPMIKPMLKMLRR
jgi:hypothetical protein